MQPHLAHTVVDMQGAELQALGVGRRRLAAALMAAQQGADVGQQQAWAHRLAHIVIGAQLQPQDLIEVVGARRQHQDRPRIMLAAQRAANRQAVFAGQHQVENHQGRLLAQNPRHRLRAVGLNGHAQAIGFEVLAGQLGQTLIVFHDKNLPALLLHHTHSCDRRAPIETRGIVTTPGVLHSACQRLSKTQHIVLSCDACSIFKGHCQSHLTGDEWSPQGNPKAHAG